MEIISRLVTDKQQRTRYDRGVGFPVEKGFYGYSPEQLELDNFFNSGKESSRVLLSALEANKIHRSDFENYDSDNSLLANALKRILEQEKSEVSLDVDTYDQIFKDCLLH